MTRWQCTSRVHLMSVIKWVFFICFQKSLTKGGEVPSLLLLSSWNYLIMTLNRALYFYYFYLLHLYPAHLDNVYSGWSASEPARLKLLFKHLTCFHSKWDVWKVVLLVLPTITPLSFHAQVGIWTQVSWVLVCHWIYYKCRVRLHLRVPFF